MSINHLKNLIGENLNIGATKFQALDYILFGGIGSYNKQGVGVKTDPVLLTTSRKNIWGEVLSVTGSGVVNNVFSYQWDLGTPSKCVITLLEVGANLNANGSPLILANCSALTIAAPIQGGFVNSCTVISPTQLQVETHATIPSARPFMLCVVY